MKKFVTTLLLCALNYCIGWGYTVDNLPVVTEYTDSTDFTMVCNPDGILSSDEVDSLNAMLWTIRQTKGVQGYVVCIKEMDPDDPYEFGIRVFNKYGIGGKVQNAGFLVLLATENRGYYINTGEGMEKYLTDAQCATIERHYMVPRFKEGDWGAGIIDGVKMICDVCSGEAELNASNESESSAEDGDALLGFLVIFGPLLGCGGMAAYQNWRKKKCPKCGEHKLKRVKRVITKVTKPSNDGKRSIPLKCLIEDYYTCESCNYQQVVKFGARYNDFHEGTFYGGLDNWGAVVTASSTASGGYGRGRSSSSWGGGGSSHSSFGGGFSSGGGAGGRF